MDCVTILEIVECRTAGRRGRAKVTRTDGRSRTAREPPPAQRVNHAKSYSALVQANARSQAAALLQPAALPELYVCHCGLPYFV